jgi:Na+/proline symporter
MIDLLIILAFIIYSISNGFRNRSKASKNLEEYFLAGRLSKDGVQVLVWLPPSLRLIRLFWLPGL